MAQPVDIEMGEANTNDASTHKRAPDPWFEYPEDVIDKGLWGLSFRLSQDNTLGHHHLYQPAAQRALKYLAAGAQRQFLAVLERDKNGPSPPDGEFDEHNEDLCRMLEKYYVFLLKFAAVCNLPVPSKTGLKRLEDMVKIHLGTNHQLPSIENPEQYRTLAPKDPVYRLIDFLLSNDWTSPWLFWLPGKATLIDGETFTETDMRRVHVTAMVIKAVGIGLGCFLPVCLLIFGSGSTQVFSGLSLAICAVAVAVMLYGAEGGMLLVLTYLTMVITAVLTRQFASSS
ncbi:hypothetical protein SAPIO_CDS2974 [Scedosporium apiospermum]|uniref:Uncharacterized protein n=1 Tax=Pseudallescheria apiosperma TaxID=563466 RepID=A0A084GBY9_PSEDA|nr:uncharacterized protein SAPIO_CDS2974 [Scedosporium apiospermum]KEZ44851.1 hypothetical protein SAPIO_CDS2974 [Scedosporium apiospermum]